MNDGMCIGLSAAAIGRNVLRLAVLCGIAAFPAVAVAHPISITSASVLVQREKISVKLDVFVEDLFLFHSLQPNADNFLPPDSIAAAREKHRGFLLERFIIRDVAGELVRGKVLKIEEFEMPAEGIGMGDLMNFSYSYHIEYAYELPPDYLTFSQRMVDQNAGLPAETRMEVIQAGSESPFYVTLYPETPETIRFDWTRPPLSPEASEAEWSTWYESRKQQELGITDYGSVYSFVYIEDHEVRHEILIPLLTLETSVLIPRRDAAFLELEEQEEARTQIGSFFAAGNPMEIDGVLVEPHVDRIDFYGVDIKDFARQAPARRVSMANARAGVILSYSCKNTPSRVQLTWDQFNEDIWRVDSRIYAFEDIERQVFSSRQPDNVYIWQNPGRPPLPQINNVRDLLPELATVEIHWFTITATTVTLLVAFAAWCLSIPKRVRRGLFLTGILACLLSFRGPQWVFPDPFAATPVVSDEDAKRIVEVLQHNVYRAFDYSEEGQIYDALAKSVQGDLLEELYLEVQNGLQMEEQGGAKSKVQEVRLLTGELAEPFSWDSGFQVRCQWNVAGTVEHWGHVHTRVNQYNALIRVQPADDAWRIIDFDVLDEDRLSIETEIRGL
jgi:hypothetical protein